MTSAPGPHWTLLPQQPRTPARAIVVAALPVPPGVYAWLREGEAVYAGKASGRGGLQDRLGKHLETGLDLSRSSLRRNVADHLLGIPTAASRRRPSQMAAADVDKVNQWILSLDLAWLVLSHPRPC